MIHMLKNEKGLALITVLFILVLFTVLGLSVLSITMQSSKVRTYVNEETDGKMLAEMGMLYFKKKLEKDLSRVTPADLANPSHPLRQAMENPGKGDELLQQYVDKIAANQAEDKNLYKFTPLPDSPNTGFAIGYVDCLDDNGENALPYKDGKSGTSQPYVRKLKVSVLGVPKGGANAGSFKTLQKQVKLTSTVYINTVPAPFHYAISTSNELRLFGGTNIIGDVLAPVVVTSTDYRYSEETEDNTQEWKTAGEEWNKPYIEGNLFLLNDTGTATENGIYQTGTPKAEAPTEESLQGSTPIATRQALRSAGIMTPKTLADDTKTELSAPKPYLPGYEPPFLAAVDKATLFRELTVQDYIKEQIKKNRPSEPDRIIIVENDESLSFEEDSNGFKTKPIPISTNPMFIASRQKPKSGEPPSLTVRLTSDVLYHQDGKQLFIAPDTPDCKATVEMGDKDAFTDSTANANNPFTFNGSIFIDGDLDIIKDIDMTGTIYVTGDVTIREASNSPRKNPDKENNLAIIAGGKITLTDRYTSNEYNNPVKLDKWFLPYKKDEDNIPPFSAFLYSDSTLELYSVKSINLIRGGIANGSSTAKYMELNTKREADSLASRLSIQFSRGIFERATPGLPPGDQFFIDMYDEKYENVKSDITFTSS
ncbi:hypothetical protein [Aneurinibacillus aneurinilyticus]|uniref:Type 4 fimbrial biogenesis protein PilX N-terminal domain-containing protein n=1 Tax=Aneurinibacillus aneurinilyticus TaxID=1391 RepID=A0A848CV45_ANEAE|nr:hypothetical protein [Aneurinibacillus aneurinilyticus]NME99018.1 hypothetical protein [Aneurinibacillus aneurinilyticus]